MSKRTEFLKGLRKALDVRKAGKNKDSATLRQDAVDKPKPDRNSFAVPAQPAVETRSPDLNSFAVPAQPVTARAPTSGSQSEKEVAMVSSTDIQFFGEAESPCPTLDEGAFQTWTQEMDLQTEHVQDITETRKQGKNKDSATFKRIAVDMSPIRARTSLAVPAQPFTVSTKSQSDQNGKNKDSATLRQDAVDKPNPDRNSFAVPAQLAVETPSPDLNSFAVPAQPVTARAPTSGSQSEKEVAMVSSTDIQFSEAAESSNFQLITETPKQGFRLVRRNLFGDSTDETTSGPTSFSSPEDYFSSSDISWQVLDLPDVDSAVVVISVSEDLQPQPQDASDTVNLSPEYNPTVDFEASFDNIFENVLATPEDIAEDLAAPHEEQRKRSRQYVAPEKLTRKRQSHPDKWKRNIIKEKISKGEEYINSRGKIMRARKLQPPCDLSCRFKCFEKLTEENRQKIFDGFYSKQTTREQKWGFISRHVVQKDKKTNIENSSRRQHSRKYSLRVDGEDIQVCKTMFQATLDIGEGMIETVCKKTSDSGQLTPDKRGKHSKSTRTLNPNIKQSVRDHIALLPRVNSNYTRADTSKEYLIQEIQSVKEMHSLYSEWMEENNPGDKIATYRQYSDVFRNEYNISFFLPKKDLCDLCVQYDNSTEEGKILKQEEYDDHIKKKDLAQSMKEADKAVARMRSSTKLVVACFDYEKSLICPKSNASVFFYRRKLTVSNLTIVDVGRNKDYCYVYDESIAGKGSNEVGSILYDFIKINVEAGITEFRFYSDNCWGQNKNRGVAAALLHAAAKFGICIRLRYLEKGHTYNSADNVHSLIERKTRPLNIYSPNQWYQTIASCKRNNPIKVVEVKQENIWDWKALAEKLNLEKDKEGMSIPWQQIRELSMDGASPHEMKFKVLLDDQIPKLVCSKKVGRPVNLKDFQPEQAYSKHRPIAKNKYADLMYYCNNNFIPLEHQAYYRGLEESNNDGEDLQEEGNELPAGRARKRRQPNSKRAKKSPTVEDDGESDADSPPPVSRKRPAKNNKRRAVK